MSSTGQYETMKTASGAEVSGKIFNNHESAAIIVQEKNVEPTEPQEKYHVLFPKCSVKQGESAEIKVSFLHGSSPKLLKEIKADSANITRMPVAVSRCQRAARCCSSDRQQAKIKLSGLYF